MFLIADYRNYLNDFDFGDNYPDETPASTPLEYEDWLDEQLDTIGLF